MLSEYITSLADVSFHIVAYMYAVSVFGKKSYAVCGFLAYFCAVLRFSDPPYAPLLNATRKFVLPRVHNLKETITVEQNHYPRMQKVPFRLTCVAQKCLCFMYGLLHVTRRNE